MIERLSWHNAQAIKKLLVQVQQDELFLGTTDTVLGLMGNITQKVQDKIDNVKQRKEKPYVILQDSMSKVAKLARMDSIHIERFLQLCWPGPVTVILPKHEDAPDYAGSHETVAIRIPQHTGLLALLKELPLGLYSTSANISGEPIPSSIAEVTQSIVEACCCFIESGKHEEVPSTIIDCTQGELRIVREGAYPIERLLDLYKQTSNPSILSLKGENSG